MGLPGLRVLDEFETWERVYFDAEVAEVLCGKCGNKSGLRERRQWNSIVINDTPARGCPTEIELQQYKYRCTPCARTFVGGAPEIDTRQKMTRRLIRYIQDSVMHRPRSAIAREVGIEPDRVKGIALKLADRLSGHKFPTPRVLGIDDIRMNGEVYTIFTDSERGHAIGLIKTARLSNIAKWVRVNIDCPSVDIVVSDLAAAIAGAVKLVLPDAVHVVDRWHVQRACQKAVSAVITKTLVQLDKDADVLEAQGVKSRYNAPGKEAATIRDLRPALLGFQQRKPAAEKTLLDDRLLDPVLAHHPVLSRAVRARLELVKVYSARDDASARQQIARFYAAAKHAAIAAEMRGILNRVKRHEGLILNYFGAQDRFPEVAKAALTTSSTENRNGKLRRSWRAGRGVRNFNYLRMLALYEPWRLDRDILLCGGSPAGSPCQNTEGPVTLVPGLVGQDPDRPMKLPPPWRCQSCRPPVFVAVQSTD